MKFPSFFLPKSVLWLMNTGSWPRITRNKAVLLTFLFCLVLFFCNEERDEPVVIDCSLHIESFGNIEEANMVRILSLIFSVNQNTV